MAVFGSSDVSNTLRESRMQAHARLDPKALRHCLSFLTEGSRYMMENTHYLTDQDSAMGHTGLAGGQVPERWVNLVDVSSAQTQSALRQLAETDATKLRALAIPGLAEHLWTTLSARFRPPETAQTPDLYITWLDAAIEKTLGDVRALADELEAWATRYRAATADRYNRELNETVRAVQLTSLYERAKSAYAAVNGMAAVLQAVIAAELAVQAAERAEADARRARYAANCAIERASRLLQRAQRERRALSDGEEATPESASSEYSDSDEGDSDD
jgi:hypothetical protein